MKRYNDRQKRNIVKNNYNAIARVYDENYGGIDSYTKYVREFLNKVDRDRIVELGCGSGAMANYMYECGKQVIAVDFSTSLLNIARRKYPNVEFYEADICEYIPAIKYDGLITKDVLFHLPTKDLERVLKNFKRILKTGGKYCIIMDVSDNIGENIYTEELDDRYEIYYNYMPVDTIKDMLVQTGLKVDDVRLIDEFDNASTLFIHKTYNNVYI